MKEIKLTQGKIALVDDEDFEYLNQWNWGYLNKGCAGRTLNHEGETKTILMHRVILNTPKGMHVDHKDRNPLNNQRNNIRSCTCSQNQQNKKGWGHSGYKGVYIVKYKDTIRYRSMIQLNKICIHIGYFDSLIDAAKAYDNKAKNIFGEYALLNFYPS